MSEISQWEAKAMGLAERLRASEARVKELAEKWTHDMKEAEQRIRELEGALRYYDGLSPDEMEDDRDEAGEYGFTARRILCGEGGGND